MSVLPEYLYRPGLHSTGDSLVVLLWLTALVDSRVLDVFDVGGMTPHDVDVTIINSAPPSSVRRNYYSISKVYDL